MRLPSATWVGPTVNRNPGGMGRIVGVCLHIQEGNEQGTEAWQHNPTSKVSSHFLLPKVGGVRQMVDTVDKAWCQGAGNDQWLSIECEGNSGDSLTPAQVQGAAVVLAWAHQKYGVRLVPCDNPRAVTVDAGGVGYHSMGISAGWSPGGHTDCPGTPIISQRMSICSAAQQLLGGTPMPLDPADEQMLKDIHYVATSILMPDGSRQPLQVAMAQLLKQLDALVAKPDADASALASALLSQGLAAQVATALIDKLRAP